MVPSSMTVQTILSQLIMAHYVALCEQLYQNKCKFTHQHEYISKTQYNLTRIPSLLNQYCSFSSKFILYVQRLLNFSQRP
jgi:hypothetical protein